MTEKPIFKDKEFQAWCKSELNDVVKQMTKSQAVVSAAVEATPVWTVPYKILIAKVWGAAQKSQFIWTISGEDFVTDHIAGSMATNPRDVAKHFALKWQLNAEQFLQMAGIKPMTEASRAGMKAQAEKLIRNAESLYDFTTRDDIWDPV